MLHGGEAVVVVVGAAEDAVLGQLVEAPEVCDLPVPAGDAARPEVPHEHPHRPEHVGVEVDLVVEGGHLAGVDESEPGRAGAGGQPVDLVLLNASK